MSVPRSLAIVSLIATLHGFFFIWYQRPDWNTHWPDQDGYRRLASVLADTGRFTRFPDAPSLVPEVIRTPAYPLFVAALYKAFGRQQMVVAVAQTLLFVLICLLVYDIGRQVTSVPIAVAAAAATALFSPIPYFAALVMTEVWTTFLFVASIAVAVRAVRGRQTGTFAIAGVVIGLTTLSRPVFVLFPVALAAIGLLVVPAVGIRSRPALLQWVVLCATFALTMLPWLTYNYATLGRFTLSPAGGVGRGLWEGSWQATWTGRLQKELTDIADETNDRSDLDRRVLALAERERLPPEPMLDYVHQWQDIRRIWTEPVDPHERAIARVEADREYLRVGVANLRRDNTAHLAKRLARGVFVLWAGEIPFRYSQINQLPPSIIRACWALQTILMGAALFGSLALIQTGRTAAALVVASPLLYITAVHFPLLTEARQSLPAQPLVILLAAIGIARALGRRVTCPENAGS
jgi:hypothetical protein